MAISEVISVDAGPGIAGLREFADAAESAAAKYEAAMGKLKPPGAAGGAGADKLAASMEAAATKIEQSAARITGTFDKLAMAGDKMSAAGTGADKLAAQLAGVGDAGKSAAAGLDAMSQSGAAAGDALKGVGDSAKGSEKWLADYNVSLRATADMQKRVAASAVEQDAVMARSARTRSSAAKQAAVDAEASSRKHETLMLGIAAAAGYGIYKAAQLQTGVTRLYTSAGESLKNLPMMTQGILKMSGQTATSQPELAQGAYMIESAGFHGKDALSILRAAAQGAQAEGAPLGEVGNALTSLMISYGMKPGQATSAMNQIITMVGSGKMTMQGAVGALPNLLPVASKAGLSFGQAGGALATMTQTGMSPDQAAQNLAHTIGSLQAPSHVQTLEMQQLGINSVQLSKNLGKEGLTGAITQVETAILHHMGPAGTVLLNSLNSSKLAAHSAVQEIAAMPPSLRSAAQAYLDGGVTAKQWRTELQGLPAIQGNLLKQFASTADAAHGFNNQLKAGGGNAQTFTDALKKAMGGQVGMNTALMLGGAHMATFKANADAVSQSAKDAGMNVKGWSDIQKTFNYQLHAFRYSAEAAATTVGTALLPAATGAMKFLAGAGSFLVQHPAVTKDLAIGGGLLGAGYLARKVASPVMTGLRGVGKVAEVLHIPGLDKLANLGKDTGLAGAATGLDGAAGALRGAAAELSGAAGRLAGEGSLPGVAGGSAARAAERDAAAAAETAGGASIMSRMAKGGKFLGALAGPVGMGLVIADTIVKPALQSMRSGPGGRNWWENPFGMAGPHDRGSSGNWLSSFSPYERLFHTGGTPNAGRPLYSAPSGAAFRVAGPSAPAAAARVAPVKIPPPDTSALDAARMKITATLQTIGSGHPVKPIKIPPPDMSALDGAKAKALSAGEGIQQAAQSPLHKPVKASTPDLSAYRAAVGPAAADGAAVSAGFAGGIESGKGAAVAAASDVASAAAAAMAHTIQSHSPSRVTHREGENFTAGFEHGIKSRAHHVKAAVAGLSASAITSLTQGLQGGKSAIDAAMQAITGKGSRPQDITTIAGTITTLEGKVSAALKSKQVGLGQGTALTAMLQMDNQRLQQLAQKRAMLEQEITDAQQVAQSAVSSASIVTAGQGSYVPAMANGPIAAAQTLQGMQMMAGDQSQFASTVKQLQKAGLNSTSLDQIIQSGAQQGLPVALGLLQGGKGAISQANTQEKSILKSASALGDVGGPAMYQAGAQLGQEAASGLKSALGAVDAAMKQIAQQLVADVDKALHIPAPHAGHAAPRRLAPLHPAPHGHGGTVVHNVTVHLNVQGSVSTEHDLVSHIQEHVLTRANNNWQTGWRHPGRAA